MPKEKLVEIAKFATLHSHKRLGLNSVESYELLLHDLAFRQVFMCERKIHGEFNEWVTDLKLTSEIEKKEILNTEMGMETQTLSIEQILEYCKAEIERETLAMEELAKDNGLGVNAKLDSAKAINRRKNFYKSVSYVIEFNTILDPQELGLPDLELEMLEDETDGDAA